MPRPWPLSWRSVLALLGAIALASCHRAAGERVATIAFAADQLGYLAPCGCSEHQLGGAARAVAYLSDLARGGPTLFIQGGNLLFGNLAPRAEERPELKAKAKALSRSWELGAAKARARIFRVGPFDLALGDGFARAARDGESLLSGPRVVEISGLRIGLLPLDAPPAPGSARAGAAKLKGLGAELLIALVQAPRPSDAAVWAAAAGADLALQAGVVDPIPDTDEAALLSAPVPTFRVKDKGRGLLRLSIHRPARLAAPGVVVPEPESLRAARAADLAKVIESDRSRQVGASGPLRALLEAKIRELSARRAALSVAQAPPVDRIWVDFQLVELTDRLPEAPDAKRIFERYTADIAASNLLAQAAKSCPSPAPGQLHYVGIASCRECHPDPAAVYDKTRHAKAYQTLVDKGRQYDLECIRCHVVGYDQPGGVCRLDRVGSLGNVQCESCHGMGSAHAESAGGEAVPLPHPGIEQCLRCHTPDNDTRFGPETYVSYYLPRILGPGHGKSAQ